MGRAPHSPKPNYGNGSSSNHNSNSNHSNGPQQQPHRPQLHTPIPRVRANSSTDSSDYANQHNSSNHSNHNSNSNNTVPLSVTGGTTTVSPRRTRFNSRDNTYTTTTTTSSGGGDASSWSLSLLPLECERSKQALLSKVSFMVFLSTYVTLLLLVQAASFAVVQCCAVRATPEDPYGETGSGRSSGSGSTSGSGSHYYYDSLSAVWMPATWNSWTLTNLIHLLFHLAYVHWCKGSYLLDEQGELNAMTLWEQLEATPDDESSLCMRRTLLIVPTVVTLVACGTAGYDTSACVVNTTAWGIAVVLCKQPCMNGVRLFGINRTAGIDDGVGIGGVLGHKKVE